MKNKIKTLEQRINLLETKETMIAIEMWIIKFVTLEIINNLLQCNTQEGYIQKCYKKGPIIIVKW